MERRKMLKNITEICRKHENKNNVKVSYLEISTLKSRKPKEESNSWRE